MRPDRSDANLPPEEAAKIEEETRRYFESLAPKRHPKPSRSDTDPSGIDDRRLPVSDRDSIPEFRKLRDLASNPRRLVCEGGEVVEEYVETGYYEDLNCIDKQHHTTGTGFIKVEKPPADGDLGLKPVVSSATVCQPAYRGNPATNEWIPSADPVIPVSNKPSRSDV